MSAGGVAALRTATPPLRLSAQVASVCDTLCEVKRIREWIIGGPDEDLNIDIL